MANREAISIFHMLKIGVGPSSSHTLGPWRAAQRWIEELKEQGKTIILITHDTHLAWNYAERLIIMKDGKIEIDGLTDSIMKDEDKLRTCNITVPNSAKLYNKYLSLNKLN